MVKGYQSKTSVKNTTLRLVKKTIPITLDLLKSTCLRKLKGFFYACHCGVSFDKKTWFGKPRILVMNNHFWVQMKNIQCVCCV